MLPAGVIDAHHHLWDLTACHYPWLMAHGETRFFGDPAPIQKNYLVGDYLADAADTDLVDSVHIQVGVDDRDIVNETRWVQSVAEEAGLPGAIVAFADLAADGAEATIEQHRQSANLRGIRQIVGRAEAEDAQTKSPALLDDARWQARLVALANLDLSFDLQLTPPHTLRAAAVLDAIPDTRVAVCHCGSPWDQSPEGLAGWRKGLVALARRPHTYCKLSGFGMFDHHWTVDSIATIVHTVIEVFGSSRCMFGSNFPVDKLHRDWHSLWSAYDVLTTQYSDGERARLFSGTAREFYRLD